MLPAPKRRLKDRPHHAREYKRVLRPQKDLTGFFGPLVTTLALVGLISLAFTRTVGLGGVMPEYETSAVRDSRRGSEGGIEGGGN
jgi:hypothetical protein